MLATVDEVIEALGGTGAVSDAKGLPASTVSSWRIRGSIPADRWHDILELAHLLGRHDITAELLTMLHARPNKPSEAHT